MTALGAIEAAIMDALTLVDGIEPEELSRSRLTRAEIVRLLCVAGEALAKEPLPEIDREGWAAAVASIRRGEDGVLWSVLTSLAPVTLIWLRSYRTQA